MYELKKRSKNQEPRTKKAIGLAIPFPNPHSPFPFPISYFLFPNKKLWNKFNTINLGHKKIYSLFLNYKLNSK